MKKARRKVLLVTGLSGAGMSTALKSLEDSGFKAVDNLPLALVEMLLKQKEGRNSPVAIGIDSRTWDFSAAGLLKKMNEISKTADVELLFMDCDDEVLQRRFTETRRLHPLAADRPVRDGIALERQMMRAAKKAADHVIDTSAIKSQDLRRLLTDRFVTGDDRGIVVSLVSFGYKNGIPREADLVFDVRFLDNPYWDDKLRPLSGLDRAVVAKIEKDKAFKPFFRSLTDLLSPLLPRYDHEGKNYLTVAFGCTGGRHRSVFVADRLGKWLEKKDYTVTVRHRDMVQWATDRGLKAKKRKKA